jgi:branched-chain amino acid transport system substrate-binding protein
VGARGKVNPTALALLAVTVLVAACSDPPPTPPEPVIKIASELPLAARGVMDAQRAVAAAIAGHSRVHGYRLVHVSLDDSLAGSFDSDRALQNAKRMLSDPQILGVVGPWNSDSARLVVPVTGQDSLVMISPSVTGDCITARPTACFKGPTAKASANNFFRVAARDSVGARAAADLAIKKLGVARFAVITHDDPYARSLGEGFRSEFELSGGKVVFSRMYSPTASTYAPLLREARDAGAQGVYMGGASFIAACLVRRAMGGIFSDDAYFISGDGIVDDDCIKDAGTTANDHLVATISAREPSTVPAALRGLSLGHFYDGYNFAAYDCAQILIAAIERAIGNNGGKIPTREQVLSALAATEDFKGLTGTFSFDANGDAIKPAVSFYNVRGGSWTFWQNAP